MRYVTIAALASGLALFAAGAQAQVDKRNFNFNVTPCPVGPQGLPTVNYDKFTDGTPLPNCARSVGNGNVHMTMVWIGHNWAVYGPSIKTINVGGSPAPLPTPVMPPTTNLPAMANLTTARSSLTGQEGRLLYGYNNKWYTPTTTLDVNSPAARKLITDCGGHAVCADGSLLSTNGGNLVHMSLIGSDSAGINLTPHPGIIGSNSAGVIPLSSLATGHLHGNPVTYYSFNGAWYTAQVIAAGGGNLIAAGGGNIIAQDTHGSYYHLTKVIAAGGGNIISDNSEGLQQKIIANPNNITINQGSNLRR